MADYSMIVKVEKVGKRYKYTDIKTGQEIEGKPNGIYPLHAKIAFEGNLLMARITTKGGNTIWRKIKSEEIPASNEITPEVKSNDDISEDNIPEFIQNSYKLKPTNFMMNERNWKYGIWASLRGEGIFTLGYSGCGKTMFARSLAKALNRPFFKFNMGSMQDAQSALIGNTHYSPDKGTFFKKSEFITAITTPKAIILLDELSRISQDAENILMTVLDKSQRYLRLDQDPNTPIIEVAEGVTFVATANVGAEFTSTRIIDRATKDRFSAIIELEMLSKADEVKLLKMTYPNLNPNYVNAIAEIAEYTRNDASSENRQFQTIISTRSTIQQGALAMDGFRFTEIMEALVYPMFSDEGGSVDSERGHIRQFTQKLSHLDNESPIKIKKSKEASSLEADTMTASFKSLFDKDNDTMP